MVGAGTVRRDDPSLNVRLSNGRDPVRVVVSRTGELPPQATLLAHGGADHRAVRAVRSGAEQPGRARRVIETGGDLRGGLPELARRGLLDIMCEGGPTLAAALPDAGLLDRLVLFVAPLLIGRGAPDLLAFAAVDSIAAARRLTDVEWRQIGPDLLVEGRLAAPVGED